MSRVNGNGGGQQYNLPPSSSNNNQALDAQTKASKEQDANQAKLIALQSAETIKKQTLDVYNAIQSGKDDSSNKKISATAQSAKGVSY
ncbi:hypothetical protein J3P85_17215 [Pseudomonas sp. Z1-12]